MKRRHVPPLLVALIGFTFLIHAQLTPRYVNYSLKELNVYTEAVDSLRGEINKRDSLLTLCNGDLRVSEWNNRAVIAQLDLFTEGK